MEFPIVICGIILRRFTAQTALVVKLFAGPISMNIWKILKGCNTRKWRYYESPFAVNAIDLTFTILCRK